MKDDSKQRHTMSIIWRMFKRESGLSTVRNREGEVMLSRKGSQLLD